jgi:hypothetical protein
MEHAVMKKKNNGRHPFACFDDAGLPLIFISLTSIFLSVTISRKLKTPISTL